MNAIKESNVTRRIIAHLKELKQSGRPIWYTKLHGGPMQRAGLPDLIVIYYGHAIAVEIKRPGGKATQLQVHTLDEMRHAGAWTVVADNLDAVVDVLETIACARFERR